MGLFAKLEAKDARWNYVHLFFNILFIVVMIVLFVMTRDIMLGKVGTELNKSCDICLATCSPKINFSNITQTTINVPTSSSP